MRARPATGSNACGTRPWIATVRVDGDLGRVEQRAAVLRARKESLVAGPFGGLRGGGRGRVDQDEARVCPAGELKFTGPWTGSGSGSAISRSTG
jgi:hypothetical protein